MSDTIAGIRDIWNPLTPQHNIFLQEGYLQLTEDHPPKGSMFLYMVVYKADQPHGILYFQHGTFRAADSVNTESNFRSKEKGFSRRMQAQVSKLINVETLIFGNILLTGENGYHFPQCDDCTCAKDIDLVDKAIATAARRFGERGKKPSLLFLKDYYPDSAYSDAFTDRKGYTRTTFEPSMEMEIDPAWETYQDFLAAVRSKYRVKFKKVNKKLEPIKRKELSLEEIIERQEEIYNFYLAIQRKAGFNLVQLHPQYFEACKRLYGDKFKVYGLFEGDEMIAFHSFFILHDELDAHWLGYTESKNKQYELYFNMLLLAVKTAIDFKKSRILFARTAMEIKSSVGAEPHQMYVYLKHQNRLLNKAIPKVADFLKGNEDWVQRKPFKG